MKRFAVLLLRTLAAIMTPAIGAAPLHLSPLQAREIAYAYRIGGLRLSAIILQESSACANLHGIDPKAHGCGQMHSATWDHVAGFDASDWWLDHDYGMSIRAANLYLEECTRDFGWRAALTCYHVGVPAASHMTYYQLNHSPYLATIERRMRELQALPLSED